MKITLRQRQKNNKISLYLEYYEKGRREYEYLNLYLTPDPEKGSLTKFQKDDNKRILELAETIRSKRHLEVQNNIYGFKDKDKVKGSFKQFFSDLAELKRESLGNYGNWNAVRIYIDKYSPKDVSFERVNKDWVQGFRDYLDRTVKTKHGKPLALNSKYSYFNKLIAALNHAVKEQIIPSNPAYLVEPFPQDETQREFLTLDELTTLANRGKLKQIQDAAGVREFEYGPLGEIIKDTRTMITPGQPIRTYKQEFEYDSWNRLQTMTYPGGELVYYNYDQGGQLFSVQSALSVYINETGYNEFSQKVYCQFGNGSSTSYSYTPELLRLDLLLSLDGSNSELINSQYSYDLIGNILGVENTADPVGLMGGNYENIYTYDDYNRLIAATGSWTGASNQTQGNPEYSSFELVMGYENMHRINSKTQIHLLDGAAVGINSYENKYEYGDPLHPNAVSKITELLTQEEELFSYDANGNLLEYIQPAGENKNMLWDDDNLLKAIKIADDVALQHYLYDSDGERAMKGTGQVSEIELNGQPEGYEASLGNYVQYFSPYAVVGANGQLSKHYYAGSERIVSRLSGEADLYSENSHLSGSQTGSLADRQEADQEFVFDEFDLVGLQIVNQPPDPEDCEVNEDCGSILFFYHKDHLGSSSFLTDEGGFAYQFLLHLPFGETMAEQRVGGYSSRYKFTGKELDEETGLYYFGARYYDPRLSLWFGVDPMAENKLDWNPYRYGFNNPIKLIDPTGMSEQEPEYPPEDFKGTSYCDADGCFNRSSNSGDYKYTDNKGNDKGYYSGTTTEIKANRTWNNKLVSATENFYGVKEQDLRGEGGKDAVLKIASKQASIIINAFSLGEGWVGLQGASKLTQFITGLSVVNDANGLISDVTGNDLMTKLGSHNADVAKLLNVVGGFSQSVGANLKNALPKLQLNIGNIGDTKDAYELKEKYK